MTKGPHWTHSRALSAREPILLKSSSGVRSGTHLTGKRRASPLAGPPLYTKLAYGWGDFVFGLMALVFALVPLLLMRYGERSRLRSSLQVHS